MWKVIAVFKRTYSDFNFIFSYAEINSVTHYRTLSMEQTLGGDQKEMDTSMSENLFYTHLQIFFNFFKGSLFLPKKYWPRNLSHHVLLTVDYQ